MPKNYPTEVVQPLGDHNPPCPCTPTKCVEQYVKLPFSHLNPLQTDFLKHLEDDDTNLVVAAPTSSGKTLCAELFSARSIHIGRKVIYIAPMKALADEKYNEWTAGVFKHFKIEIQTGDFELTDAKRKRLDEANIIILTPEMFDSKCRCYQQHEWMHHADYIVDECHLVGMDGRGDALEVAMIQAYENDSKSRTLFLSATIPNVNDFCLWLDHLSGRKTVLIKSDYRPCKLNISVQYFKDTKGGRAMLYADVETSRLDAIIEEIKKHQNESTLVFVGSKEFGNRLKRKLDTLKITNYFHNADLEREDRSKIAEDFMTNKFNVLIATTTLAWGINSPARYVIVAHTSFGLTKMHPANIIQMVGRAGRAGKAKEGDAIIFIKESDKRTEFKRIFSDYKVSSTLNDPDLLVFHVLSYIAKNNIKNQKQLLEWYKKTLSSIQKSQITDYNAERVLSNLAGRMMIKKEETGDYRTTILGDITARMYMSPFDVSDWFNNFKKLKYLNPNNNMDPPVKRKLNLLVAQCLSECFSFGLTWGEKGPIVNKKVYLSKREMGCQSVMDVASKLRLLKPEDRPSIKYTAIFNNLLNGDDIEPELSSYAFNIKKDLDRTIETLKQVDSMFASKYKEKGKIAGFGWEHEWDKLKTRLQNGAREELYDLMKLPGIGKKSAEKLDEKGVSIKDIFDPKNKGVVIEVKGEKWYKENCE